MKSILPGPAAAALIAAPVIASAPPPTPARQGAAVEVRTAPGGVAATWRLARPTRAAAFLDRGVIRDRWTVTTPGLTLVDGVVRSTRPFDGFEMRIAPDAAEVDRVYPGLVRAGAGHVLYGPGLALDGMEAALILRPAGDETALPAARAIDGYAYLGPAAAVTRAQGAVVIAGANVPAALSGRMRDGFLAARTFYGARLGGDPPREPVLVVTTDSPGPAAFRGDVTGTGVIVTRFFGSGWDAPPADVAGQLSAFVRHETLHLWNGHGVVLRDGVAAPWLHEGGAEYGALVAAVSSGAMDEGEARAALARRLNGCRSALGDRDHDARVLRSGAAVYDCGVVIQWIADLETRAASGRRRDIFDLWRTMLDTGRAGGGYGVADFHALLPPDSGAAMVLDAAGRDRWTRIGARLAALGVVLANRPGAEDYRRAALLHLVARACTGGGGFRSTAAGIRLDTGTGCGVLSGDPLLASVEGHDPLADAAAMFAAVRARCAAGSPVRVRFADGRTVATPCAAPLAIPDAWTVTAAPPLRTRSA